MNYVFEAQQIDSIHEAWSKHMPCTLLSEGAAWHTLPNWLGEGGFKRVTVRSGMELFALDARFLEKHMFEVGVRYPHLELSFALKGRGSWSVRGSRKEYGYQSGQGSLIFLHDTQVRLELPDNVQHHHLELRMDVRLWNDLLQHLPWDSGDSMYCSNYDISPELQQVLDQILNCPYSGSIRQYYMEGKAFELIALCSHDRGRLEKREADARRLKHSDIDKLYRVKEMLGRLKGEPPSLAELARSVGLNDFKLKAGFKELFGTTVFGYIRAVRMREAKQLLEEGRVNVSEAALMVGYSNMSHFSSLFRKTYGINPREFMRQNSPL